MLTWLHQSTFGKILYLFWHCCTEQERLTLGLHTNKHNQIMFQIAMVQTLELHACFPTASKSFVIHNLSVPWSKKKLFWHLPQIPYQSCDQLHQEQDTWGKSETIADDVQCIPLKLYRTLFYSDVLVQMRRVYLQMSRLTIFLSSKSIKRPGVATIIWTPLNKQQTVLYHRTAPLK